MWFTEHAIGTNAIPRTELAKDIFLMIRPVEGFRIVDQFSIFLTTLLLTYLRPLLGN